MEDGSSGQTENALAQSVQAQETGAASSQGATTGLAGRSSLGRLGGGYSGMYGGGMFGGGLYGGGLGGMGMGGMYGGGLGMGGLGQTPGGQPGSFRQNYQNIFSGFQNLLQVLYSGLGLFAFGKLFGSMVYKMVKAIASRFFKGSKYIFSLIFMNRVSIKVINGAIARAKTVSQSSVGSIMVKAFFTAGLLSIGAAWFLMRQDQLALEEQRIKNQAMKRSREQRQLRRQLDSMRHGTYTTYESDFRSLQLENGTIRLSEFENAERLTEATDLSLREELKMADPKLAEIFENAAKEDEVEAQKLKKIEEDFEDDSAHEEAKSPCNQEGNSSMTKVSWLNQHHKKP